MRVWLVTQRSTALFSGGIAGKDAVARLHELVARKAGVEHLLVGGFAVLEVSESPAARRGVFPRVLEHELYAVLRVARDERLRTAEHRVVLGGGHVVPGESSDDR